MKYVALLRGINVGGKAKIPMPELKAIFEEAGCTAVATYINSGNVLFDDNRDLSILTPLLDAAILKKFGITVPVIIINAKTMQNICQKVPADWTNDTIQKTDVLFLWSKIDDPSILQKVEFDPSLENVVYIKGALVWNIARANAKRGSSIKLIKSDSYKFMTIRNINTVRKLNQLLESSLS